MSCSKWQIIESTELLSGVISSSAVAWSEEGQLAISTNRGLYINELVPNPNFQQNFLNFRSNFLAPDENVDANPCLSKIVQKFGLEEYLIRPGNTDNASFTLDDALPVLGKPIEGANNRKQASSIQWSPVESVTSRDSALASLNYSHWLQIFFMNLKTRSWSAVYDVTKMWFDHLRKENWSLECKVIFPNLSNQKFQTMLSRCYLVATTSFCWSGTTQVNEIANNTLLATSQKSGHLVFWKLSIPRQSFEGQMLPEFWSLEKIVETDLGPISSLTWKQMTQKDSLLFLGAKDGRVKAYLVEWTAESLSIKDLGMVWSEKDRVSVSVLEVLQASCPDLKTDNLVPSSVTLFVAKSFFALLLKLELDQDLREMTVVGKEFKNLGGSSIIGIKQLEDFKSETNLPHSDEKSSQFIIIFAEGPPQCFKLDSEPFRVEPFEFFGCSSLDFKNQSCHGLARSKHGVIWTLIQNGSLDHTKPKGKITFMTPTSDVLELLSQPADPHPDLFEVFRIKIIKSFEADHVLCKTLLNLAKENALKKTNCRLTMWLCHLMTWLTGKHDLEEESKSFKEIFDLLYSETLCDHAFEILQNNFCDLTDDMKCAMSLFVKQNYSDSSVLSKIDDLGIGNYDWTCKLCGKSSISEFRLDLFECESGHKFPKCCRTLQACDSFNLEECFWCAAVYLPVENPSIFGTHCIFCTGPIL